MSGLDGPSCNKTICPVCRPPRLGLNVTVNSVSSSLPTVLLVNVATKTGLLLTTLLIVIGAEPMFAKTTDAVAGLVGGVPCGQGGAREMGSFREHAEQGAQSIVEVVAAGEQRRHIGQDPQVGEIRGRAAHVASLDVTDSH